MLQFPRKTVGVLIVRKKKDGTLFSAPFFGKTERN